MNNKLTLALVQHVSTPGDLSAGLERISTYAEKANQAGADLLLFPEASLTGYNNSLETNRNIAPSANGEHQQAIASICNRFSIAIAYGFAERDGDSFYNSVQLIGDTGDTLAIYRKTHLWGDQDRKLFTAGDDLVPIIQYKGWSIGFLICYDIEFPENVRRLAIEGAELLLTPTALMEPWSTVADRVVPVRAYENQLFIAYANFCGNEYQQHYVGHSCIAGPDGMTMAKAKKAEVMLVATLDKTDISNVRQTLPYHRDRLPSLYQALTNKKP